jgi:FKBP-type peptidyl-prolyl cis-trans isomerase FkpA
MASLFPLRSLAVKLAPLALVFSLAGSAAAWAQPAAKPATPPTTQADAQQEPGVTVTQTGLIYRSLKDGSGASPAATDIVKVHYRGTLPDGKEFDSSYKRGEPASFPLDKVIKCWTEGVQRMKVGGKAKLVCPPAIAYGERGAGGVIPPNATLVFEVELLGIGGR